MPRSAHAPPTGWRRSSKENRYRISTGFVGTPLICDALSANGHADTAYRLLLQTEDPSWLYSVKLGATTIWERWDSLLPDGTVNPSGMTSFNHYAFGAVADWMHRVVAGLAPAAPGYRRLLIAPQPPRRGLASASARLRTPYGVAATAWRLDDGMLRLTVTVPVGVTGEVVLPSGATHEIGHGEHSFVEPFEVDAETRKAITVDTPLGEIVDDPQAMAVLTGVITKHIPEAAEHMSGALRGQEQLTPRQISGMLPRPDGVLQDLERGFAAVSAGEEIPLDVITAPEPAAADDAHDADLEAKAALLSGRDFWSTREGDGIRSLVLVDGPHGVRRQAGTADNLGFNQSLPSTCFPPGVAMGASWDPALIREIGVALGEEARALDVDVILGPGDQPQALAAGRPHVRVLLRGPAADRHAGHGVRAGGAEHRRRHLPQALRREQPGDRADACRRPGRRARSARALPAGIRARREGGGADHRDERVQRDQRGVLVGEPLAAHRPAPRRVGLRRSGGVGLGRHQGPGRSAHRGARPRDARHRRRGRIGDRRRRPLGPDRPLPRRAQCRPPCTARRPHGGGP